MLQAAVLNQETGAIDITYTPACGADDHTIVYGDLAGVGSLPETYDGASCSIGVSGTYVGFDPTVLPSPPSGENYFFLVVAKANQGLDAIGLPTWAEGSYGLGTGERAPSLLCSPQGSPAFSCD